MNIRHADEIRDFIRTNALPDYNPAIEWEESTAPFTIDEPIIYCRQEGRSVDGFVRQVSVDVHLFSGLNITNQELSQLYDDAVAALEYIKWNYNVTDGIRATVTMDVTGPYYTGQNRRYYRFQVLCYSAEES